MSVGCGPLTGFAASQDVPRQNLIFDQLAKLPSTYSRSTTTRVPLRSAASKDTVSSSRSITVCRRRAPIFSVRSFTSKATSASRMHARVSKFQGQTFRRHERRILPAIADASGSVRMRTEVAHDQRFQLDSDRQAALQFGIRSEGLDI